MVVYFVPHNLSYSQSAALVGEYCGAQAWYERVLGKPSRPGWNAVGGSALHTASERWDRETLTGELDDSPEHLRALFLEAFAEAIAETEEHSPYPRQEWSLAGRTIKTKVSIDGGPNRKDEAWWRQMGPEMLRTWTTWRLTTPWEIAVFEDPETGAEVFGIEVEYWAEMGGVPNHGFVDRVFERNVDGETEYLVVDLKSGREPDDTGQLGTYRVGLLRRFGVDPRWGAFWLGGSGSTTALTDLRRMWPEGRVDQRYAKARRTQLAGDFTHKPSNLCGSCGVRDWCPIVGGAKADEVPQPWDPDIEIRVKEPPVASSRP